MRVVKRCSAAPAHTGQRAVSPCRPQLCLPVPPHSCSHSSSPLAAQTRLGSPDRWSLPPPPGWHATHHGSGDSTGMPGCVSPGACPRRGLLLCPCGNTDTAVYSNPSGSGTATCLRPSLRNGPAFCLASLDNDNYST